MCRISYLKYDCKAGKESTKVYVISMNKSLDQRFHSSLEQRSYGTQTLDGGLDQVASPEHPQTLLQTTTYHT